MNYHKLLNKHNIGSAGLLLFFIVVSQARLFDFLINSSLGRLILICVLLCLSYSHQMLGIVGVLIISIAFNHFGIASLTEGFDTSASDTTTTADNSASSTSTDKSKEKKMSENTTTPTPTTPTPTTPTPTTPTTGVTSTTISQTNNATGGLEGFDVIGIENNLKRGKQSNTIPVSSYSRQDSDFITAYEGTSSIFGDFSLF